jgi:hypothetical protein
MARARWIVALFALLALFVAGAALVLGHDAGQPPRSARPAARVPVSTPALAPLAAASGAPASEPAPAEVGDAPEDPGFRRLKKEVLALGRACAEKGAACDERQLLVEQAALGFDYKLGARHPRRAELIAVVGWSYDQRQTLAQPYLEGRATRAELFAQLHAHMGEVSARFAALLDDEEYERMFELPKSVNPAAYMGLDAEDAAAMDRDL